MGIGPMQAMGAAQEGTLVSMDELGEGLVSVLHKGTNEEPVS